jgi:hypothetical protein
MPEGCRPAEWRSCVSVDPRLDRLGGGRGPAEWRLCLCGSPAWGPVWPSRMKIMCFYPPYSRLWGRGPQSRDLAGLCRTRGCGLAEIVNICGSPALRELGGLRGGSVG